MIIILIIFLVVGWAASMAHIFSQKQPVFQGRLLGITLGFIGLGILIFEPGYKVELPSINVSLGEQSMNDRESILKYTNVHRLLNEHDLKQLDTVFVKGIQHLPEDLDLLRGNMLIFNAERDTMGVVNLEIPDMTAFRQNTIKGTTKGIISGQVILPQQERVEVKFTRDTFAISFVAPPPGRYVLPFKLISLLGDTIYEEIPIFVNEQPSLNILTISSFPDFELNFLKNYWATKGYGFVQRIRISRDKFQTSINNHPAIEVREMTGNLLSQFDILHIDVSSWNGLSLLERNQVLQKVAMDGLGVLITPNVNEERPLGLPLIKLEEIKSSLLFTTEMDFFNAFASTEWEPWMFEAQKGGYVLQKGFGKIFMPNFINSYKLILNDQQEGYQSLWAEIFSSVYNAPSESFQLILSEPVIAERKTAINFVGLEKEKSYFLNDDPQPLIINEVPFIESLGSTTVVPELGWNEIKNLNQKEWFYAFSVNNWRLMQANILTDHAQYLNHFTVDRNNSTEEERSLPWWVGLAIMVLGFGALWLIEKLY